MVVVHARLCQQANALRAAGRSHPGAGELHNNSRMTWGKAFIGWAPPAEALAALLRCNHRFAIDGCGPCSYGGILWFASSPPDLRPCFVSVHSAHALQSARTQQLEQHRHVQGCFAVLHCGLLGMHQEVFVAHGLAALRRKRASKQVLRPLRRAQGA